MKQLNKNFLDTQPNLLRILICLTLILIFGQITFFIIHYKVSDIMDSLIQSSLRYDIFHPIILFPLLKFFLIQIVSYCFFVMGVWFIVISNIELFHLKPRLAFLFNLLIWFSSVSTILGLNNYFFPDSFFATLLPIPPFLWISCLILLFLFILSAYGNFFLNKKNRLLGFLFFMIVSLFCGFFIYDKFNTKLPFIPSQSKPNIIFIGLDSLRPDFISYFDKNHLSTPTIDSFLKNSTVFTQAYTPLARTFPAWISILTSLYPKHHGARSNLSDPTFVFSNDTLSKKLKAAGYTTIYGTDEKRFSNITKDYYFDYIIGPHMGVDDFILGSLSDFPLTNLLIKTSLGRILFPFNYANRAAAITYDPENFLQLVKLTLKNRPNKPLFLAIHLCITHWPYQWARDHQAKNFTQAQKYQSSVSAIDQQLRELLEILKENGLLKSSVVVLLSDHGTTLGLSSDRVISEKKYQGNSLKKKWVSIYKLDNTPDFSLNFKKDYSVDTSYGQGTDVLSLKQYHVLLAIRGFGLPILSKNITENVSLLDITPTILDILHLKPLEKSDGISLKSFLLKGSAKHFIERPFFLETGYSISEIESKNIFIEQVLKHAIGIYQINPKTGLLFVKSAAEKSIIQNKQRAVLFDNWLVAQYPAKTYSKFTVKGYQYYNLPAYIVIVNLKTGQWDIGLDTPLAKIAPMKILLREFYDFYRDELAPII